MNGLKIIVDGEIARNTPRNPRNGVLFSVLLNMRGPLAFAKCSSRGSVIQQETQIVTHN